MLREEGVIKSRREKGPLLTRGGGLHGRRLLSLPGKKEALLREEVVKKSVIVPRGLVSASKKTRAAPSTEEDAAKKKRKARRRCKETGGRDATRGRKRHLEKKKEAKIKNTSSSCGKNGEGSKRSRHRLEESSYSESTRPFP